MKLEEGMYIRTKDKKSVQYIRKIVDLPEDIRYSSIVVDKDIHNVKWVSKKNVLKVSENIIDLIEVGDYVNGYLVKDIDYAFDHVVMNNKNARRVPYIDCNKNNYIKDIKSIVTKEQFNSVKYEVK